MPKSRRKVQITQLNATVAIPKRRGRPKKVATDGSNEPASLKYKGGAAKRAPRKKKPIDPSKTVDSGNTNGLGVSGSISRRRTSKKNQDPVKSPLKLDLNALPEDEDMQCAEVIVHVKPKKVRAPL